MVTWKLTATRRVALGNGDREKGFEFATFDVPDDFKFEDLVGAAQTSRVNAVKEHAKLNDDGDSEKSNPVTPHECLTALRNIEHGATQLVCPDDEEAEAIKPKPRLDELPVSDLALSATVKQKLEEAGIKTAADVVKYGDDHSGFKDAGLTEAQESKLVEVIQRLV